MHGALLGRTLDELEAVRRHVSFSAKLRAQIGQPSPEVEPDRTEHPEIMALFEGAPDATNWRILDHCIVVTRAYAIYEAFVMQILREYLSFLADSYNINELGDDFTTKYTRGVGQILVDQTNPRYENIDRANLISDATTALSNKRPYQIQPEAMLRTEQNLRMDELQRLFGHCGLSGIDSWIAKHREVEKFFAAQSRLSDTPKSQLRQIVEYRNEAAHQEVDEVLGTEVLLEVMEFFEALLRSVTDFVQYEILRRAKERGLAQVLGVISEQFHNDIVVAKVANATLKVGDEIYISGKGVTMIGMVNSIQLDGVDHLSADITSEREVGLALGVRAKLGCELIRLI